MNEVVYIDDEPTICNVVQAILATAGVPAQTFTDPEQAVAYVNARPPALVICDFRMPKLNGLQVLASLTVDVPFALISGFLDLNLDDPVRPRITEVLHKPVPAEELLEFVARFVP